MRTPVEGEKVFVIENDYVEVGEVESCGELLVGIVLSTGVRILRTYGGVFHDELSCAMELRERLREKLKSVERYVRSLQERVIFG